MLPVIIVCDSLVVDVPDLRFSISCLITFASHANGKKAQSTSARIHQEVSEIVTVKRQTALISDFRDKIVD